LSIHLHHIELGGTVDDEAALVQFQKGWSIYQKVVDHNVLAHRQVGDILHRALMSVPEPIDLLDIACGDAGQMRGALADTKVRHYRGIDLSQPALELAAKNLEGVPFDVDLDHSDFVTELAGRHHTSDVSWCGLSIHHLTTDGKRDLLQALCETTRRFLMIYEPILLEGEGFEGYLDRYARLNRSAWTFLAPEEWDQLFHHISTCDLPESPSTWLTLGREAGFAEARQVYLDPPGLYAVYRYDR
jgi:hypothetical protein